MIYSFFIRFFVVLGVISSLLIENVEYKSALIILSIIYLLFFSIIAITSEGKRSIKFIFYGVDTLFLSFIIYVTGLTYLSTFVIPFFSEFTEGKEDYIFYGTFSIVPIGLSLYLSNFSDYIFIPLVISGLIAMYKLKKEYEERELYYKKLKSQMEELYKENLSFQEKFEENKAQMEIIPTLQETLQGELGFKEALYQLNDYLKSSGIAFIDFLEHKCIAVGNSECKKELLAYVKDEIQIIDSEEINEEIDAERVYSLVINDKRDMVFGILFILFNEKKTVNPKFLRVIKDYMDFYFSKEFKKQEEEKKEKEKKEKEA